MHKLAWSYGDLEAVTACSVCASTRRTRVEWRRRDNDGLFPRWPFLQCADRLTL